MKAIDLLKESEYKWITGPDDLEFDEIVLDSRKVTEKTAFVAMVGQKTDGHIHIADAAAKGAALILVEDRKLPEIQDALSSIKALGTAGVASVPDTRKAYAEMACTYFQHPSSDMKITEEAWIALETSARPLPCWRTGTYRPLFFIGVAVDIRRLRESFLVSALLR